MRPIVKAFGIFNVGSADGSGEEVIEIEAIIAACITGVVTLIGVVVANNKQSAVMAERIESVKKDVVDLSAHVEKHNGVIERVFKLEQQPKQCEEKFKMLSSIIERLEDK